jgi:hypothetical protein
LFCIQYKEVKGNAIDDECSSIKREIARKSELTRENQRLLWEAETCDNYTDVIMHYPFFLKFMILSNLTSCGKFVDFMSCSS